MYLDSKPPQILPGSEYIYVVDIEGIALIVFFPVGLAHLWLPPSRGHFGKPPTGSPTCPKSVMGARVAPDRAREAGGAREGGDPGQRHFSFCRRVSRGQAACRHPQPGSAACEALTRLAMRRVKERQLLGAFCCLRSCDSTREPGWDLNLNPCFVCLDMRAQPPAPAAPPLRPVRGGDGLRKKGAPGGLRLAATRARGREKVWGQTPWSPLLPRMT